MAYEPTYSDMIESAMGHLGVIEAGEALSGDNFKQGWNGLLSMLYWWKRFKVVLNIPDSPFDIIVNTDDTPVPDPSLKETLATNLAMHLQHLYGTNISPATIQVASESIEDLKRIGLKAYQAANPIRLQVTDAINQDTIYDINAG